MTFKSGDTITPDLAAKLASAAERFEAHIQLEHNGVRLSLDSLIGILSFDLRRGEAFTLRATGPDEDEALEAVAKILE